MGTDCKDGRAEGNQPAANEPERSLGGDVEPAANEPLADVGKNLAENCAEKRGENSDDSHTAGTGNSAEQQQRSDFTSADCSEQKENEIPPAAGGDALEQRDETAPDSDGEKSRQQVGAGAVAQPEKARKSKLEKLRELGIDLSIKPRICSGDESFINLDESESNKGIAFLVTLSGLSE